MENKKSSTRALLIMLLLLGWAGVIYLFYYNRELKSQVSQRDKLLKEGQDSDSAMQAASQQYADTISKYVDDCALIINGKRYGTDDLIKLLNRYFAEKEALQEKIDSLINDYNRVAVHSNDMADSFRVYKRIAQIAEKRFNASFSVGKLDSGGFVVKTESKYPNGGYDTAFANKSILELIKDNFNIVYQVTAKTNNQTTDYKFTLLSGPPVDSTKYLQDILRMANKAYSFNYKISDDGKVTHYSVESPVLDSALVLLPFFRHMLTMDKDGKTWRINMSGKNYRVARRKD